MKLFTSVVGLYQRGYVLVLLVLVAVTVGAVFLARTLSLDADLSQLLPETASSVIGLAELERAYGDNVGRLTVVLQGPDHATNRAAAERISQELEPLASVERIELRRPTDFFTDFRLIYVDYEDLVEADERIRRRIRWERARANPLFADLGPARPPELDLSDIEQRYEAIGEGEFFESEDGHTLVFFIHPSFSAADLARSSALVEQVAQIAAARLSQEFPGVTMAFTGRYMKRVEQQHILTSDLQSATLVALLGLLVFLVLYLRSLHATLMVLVPLIVGTIWAFAWAALIFGSLNVLTAFLGAILLGLGVDYGIHLVSRFYEVRAEEGTVGEALTITLATAGRASVFAGLTTMVALGSLSLSSFRAFFEFGIIALGGLALILLAYATVFPALIIAQASLAGSSRGPSSQRVPLSVLFAQRLTPLFSLGRTPTPAQVRRMRGGFTLLASVLAAVVVLAGAGVAHVELERDFRAVQMTDTPTWRLDEMVNDILNQSQTPAVVLVESREHARRVAEELRRRQQSAPGGYTIEQVLAPDDLLPQRQAEKLALLEELGEELAALPQGQRSEQLEAFLDEIDRVLAAAPVGEAMLPEAVRIPFSRLDDPQASVVLVFASLPMEQARVIEDFASVMRNLPGAEGAPAAIDGVSDALLLADILHFVTQDTLWIVLTTAFGVFLVALLAFGFSRQFWWLLGSLALSLFCAAGFAGVFGVDFNFLNLIILPVWLGLTVDASFHMYLRLRDEPERVQPHLSVGGSVSAAFVTSMIGFGSLLVAHHEGLLSLGRIAVIGLGTILLVNLLLQMLMVLRAQLVRHGQLDDVTEVEAEQAQPSKP
ncbi:MAG: MMPL family transporter [Bradymonadaceae bacterium]|nr:MMPL family transporter [Lujinxingiaceae bacterium]